MSHLSAFANSVVTAPVAAIFLTWLNWENGRSTFCRKAGEEHSPSSTKWPALVIPLA